MKLTTMFAVLAMTVAAIAQEQVAPSQAPKRPDVANRMPRPMMGRMMEAGRDPVVQFATSPHMAKALGLTDEQQAKIKDINKAMREKMKTLNEQQRAAMAKQSELSKADKPDEAAIMKSIDDTFEVRKNIAKEQTKSMLALRAVLTTEQLAKAAEEMKAMRNRGRKPMGPKPEAKPADAKPAEAKPAEPAKQ